MWCVFCVATDTNKHTHTHVLYKFTRGYSCTHRGCVHMRLLHRTYRLASRLCTLRTCHLIHGPPGVKPLVKQQETPVITGLFALIWTLDPNGTKHLGAHSHCFISSTVKTIIFMIVVLQLHVIITVGTPEISNHTKTSHRNLQLKFRQRNRNNTPPQKCSLCAFSCPMRGGELTGFTRVPPQNKPQWVQLLSGAKWQLLVWGTHGRGTWRKLPQREKKRRHEGWKH